MSFNKTASTEEQKSIFVLVHGGWFGGWCWQQVADRLRSYGHTVYTPTLTGLGERSHLASPQITLKTHAQDIANLLFYEDLREAYLLGHSYSGMPLTLVPGLAAERIRHLIYLDAFVSQHGDRLADLVEAPVAQEQAVSWLAPPPPLSRWHVEDPDLISYIEPRLTAHPFLVHNEPVDTKEIPELPSIYISLTRNQKTHFIKTADRLRHVPNWEVLALDAGHLVMVEEPQKLADLLHAISTKN